MEQKKDCGNTRPCECASTGCARHGKCCECVAFHKKRGDVPMCLRGKK